MSGFYWRLALRNLYKDRQIYAPYLLSATGIVAMFYILCALGPGIEQDEMYGGATMASAMFWGAGVIGVFAALFLFYTNSFIMRHRKKELGLYNILGMEKRHIARVVLCETALSAGASILLGLGFGILFSRAMFLLLGKLLDAEIPIAFSVPAGAVAATAAMFLVVFVLILLYDLIQVWRARPVELLRGGETGEREPKARWLLALLGAASLGTGYWMALTIQNPVDALTWFFVAVLFVIVGTYLLFIAGICALLKLLKKDKGFYYHPRHFTTVSGMLYRMKQNAAGLASICILFTCLLVTVSSTLALYTGMEGILRERYPRNVILRARDADDGAKAMLRDMVDEECAGLGLTPSNILERTYTSLGFTRDGTSFFQNSAGLPGVYCRLELYDLAEFNRISGRTVELGEDDVLLSDPRSALRGAGEIAVMGRVFRVIQADYDLQYGPNSADLNDTFYMVFQDRDTIRETFRTTVPDASGPAEEGLAEHTSFLYDFDVDGDREAVAALHRALDRRFGEDFPAEGASFQALSCEDVGSNYREFMAMYGGLFFLGLFLGTLFLLGTALIIYYKQVSEGYEDARRFRIMQRVGMSRDEVKKSIHSQILTVFFLPLAAAVVHLCFALPMLQKILILLNMTETARMLLSCAGCVALFGAVYAAIYLLTAKTYYKIVETAA